MRGLHAARAALVAASVGIGWGVTGGQAVSPGATPAQPLGGRVLAEYEPARMPGGLASLCEREPEFCAPISPGPGLLPVTHEVWQLLSRVNRQINHTITSTTDRKLYGKLEYWTLPSVSGDCEDYVLLKRKTLAEQGVDPALLLITVVQDETGEGHAVLTIPVAGGDIVLDNRRDEILIWNETGYRFVKRQSAADPNVWVSLGQERLQATNIASGPEALEVK